MFRHWYTYIILIGNYEIIEVDVLLLLPRYIYLFMRNRKWLSWLTWWGKLLNRTCHFMKPSSHNRSDAEKNRIESD